MQVVVSANASTDKLLDTGSGIEELLRSHRFDTIKRFSTKENFCAAKLKSGHCATRREIKGKKVEIYTSDQYEIRKTEASLDHFRRYIIAGKLATANWSGEFFEKHLRNLGSNLLVKVHGLEKEGLGYRWFHTQTGQRKSGVYFQSSQTAGRPILPSNDLDFTEIVPNIYKEGGPGCDFKDSKKPEGLLRFLLEICTQPGDLVGDFYAGSGTTLATSIKMGRSCIACDQSPHSLEVIKTRLAKMRAGKDVD